MTSPPPIVLFVGDDASSTQIAESLLRRLVGDRVDIRTAGAQPLDPGGREDQMLVMMGLNPSHEERLSVRALNTSDRVIVLGAGMDVARMPGRRYEEWDLDTISLEERIDAVAADLISAMDAVTSGSRDERRPIRLTVEHIRRRAASSASYGRVRLARGVSSARHILRGRRQRRRRRRRRSD